MLTRKQLELLQFIYNYIQKNNISPSFEEMKEAVQLRSKSGIFRLINGLAERGFIKQLRHRARALEIARMPDSMIPLTHEYKQEIPSERFSHQSTPLHSKFLEIPLYGRIAAGTPILAVNDSHETVSIPQNFLSTGIKNKNFYALEVSGDSMEEAGIFDGDIALIEKTDTAESGNIVVALVNNHEATLKKYYYKNKKITLEPANRRYQAQIYPPEQVKIQGRLRTIIRKY